MNAGMDPRLSRGAEANEFAREQRFKVSLKLLLSPTRRRSHEWLHCFDAKAEPILRTHSFAIDIGVVREAATAGPCRLLRVDQGSSHRAFYLLVLLVLASHSRRGAKMSPPL